MTPRPPEPTPENLAAQQLAIGRRLLATGAYDKATERFRAALEINPDQATAHCELAYALERQQKVKEAIAEVDIALQINPEYAYAFYLKGTFLATQKRSRQKHFKEAEALLRRAIELGPPHAPYFVMLGSVIYCANRTNWLSTQRYREAETLTRRALELDPGNVPAHRTLAVVLFSLHRPVEAWQHYAKALQLDPEDAITHGKVGAAVLDHGDPQRAVLHLTESLRQNPGDKNIQRQLKMAQQDALIASWRRRLWDWTFGRLPRLARIPVAVVGFALVLWAQIKMETSPLMDWQPLAAVSLRLAPLYCVMVASCGNWLWRPPGNPPLDWEDIRPNATDDYPPNAATD